MSKLLRKKQSINKRKKKYSTSKKISSKKRKTSRTSRTSRRTSKKKRVTRKNNNIKGGSECEIKGYIKKNDIQKVVSKQPNCQICHEKFKIPSNTDNGEGDDAIYRTECCHVFHLNCLEATVKMELQEII